MLQFWLQVLLLQGYPPACAPAATPHHIGPGCWVGCWVAQVLRLGPGITGLSLSPTQELLATTHANHRGIYLWANQVIVGHGATDLAPYDVPVMPSFPCWLQVQPLHPFIGQSLVVIRCSGAMAALQCDATPPALRAAHAVACGADRYHYVCVSPSASER